MRICLYGYTIGTKGSGASQYALDLGKWLAKEGHEVTLVTGKWGDRTGVSEELKYIFLVSHDSPVSKRAQIDFTLRSMWYFRKHRRNFDLIHSLSSFPHFARLAPWIKKVTGLPVIHSILAPCEPQPYFDPLDGLISVSKGIQERICSNYNVYIPPPINVERFRSSYRYDWQYPENVFIGTMGAPFRRKGIRYIVETIPLVLKKYSNVHFFLAIDLPGIQFMEETRREREYIGRFIQEHRLQDKVDILGHVEVPPFLKSLDIFIFAVQTTFGMIDIPPTLLECLAAGCAVITTRKNGINELIEDNYNGLLIDERDSARPEAYAEKIIELLQNEPLLARIKKNGPLSVKRFELNQVGKQIIQFYEKVLKHERGKA